MHLFREELSVGDIAEYENTLAIDIPQPRHRTFYNFVRFSHLSCSTNNGDFAGGELRVFAVFVHQVGFASKRGVH